MTDRARLGRRRLVAGATGAFATTLIGGCDRLTQDHRASDVLGKAEDLSRKVQGLVTSSTALAREYPASALSPVFKPNGTTDPNDDDYQEMAGNNFKDWKLELGGLVERPAKLSLSELRELPSRTQITRHDCVEGWSCIGKWKGVVLADLLHRAGLRPAARYLVFYCADPMDDSVATAQDKYYESIGLDDAFHPQTILAYEMNDQVLPVANGAPLRLRVERQLGYKMAKYVMRIEAVESFAQIGGGKGGYWEDNGYSWYAGI